MEKISRKSVKEFFLSREVERDLTPKAQALMENIAGWPAHIPKGPIYRLASALTGEKLPHRDRGFLPFTFRTITGEDNFDLGSTVLVLTKFGETAQPACTAKQIRLNQHLKKCISWKAGSSRPATEEEIERFLEEAFTEV